MATRSSAGGTFNAANVITAANLNSLPGGILAYQQITSNVSGLNSNDQSNPNEVLMSVTVTPRASRLLRISWSIIYRLTKAGGAVGTDNVWAILFKDGTYTNAASMTMPQGNRDIGLPGFALDVGPTAAAHIYEIHFGFQAAGEPEYQVTASPTLRSFMMIEDVGPSF